MKKILKLSLLIFGMVLFSCDRHSGKSPILGHYELLAYDQSGQRAFTGTISVTSLDQNHVKGQCTVVREKTAPEGIRDESGNCEGLLDGNTVSFDSAPSLDDAGLLLEGQFANGRITGVWRIDGFATTGPLGKFEAVKKN